MSMKHEVQIMQLQSDVKILSSKIHALEETVERLWQIARQAAETGAKRETLRLKHGSKA